MFGKKKEKFDYFEAFERSAQLVMEEAEILVEATETFTAADAMGDLMARAHEVEHRGDENNHEICHHISHDFITPIEREDLLDLAHYLDNVIDEIEDVIQHFYMYDIHEMNPAAIQFAHLIRESAGALIEVMAEFHNFKKSEKFMKNILEVNAIEERGDHLFVECIRELHTVHRERPMYVHVWSQILERMEECVDECEHVSDIVENIMLKNA